MSETLSLWPPLYTLTQSARAKRLSLKVTPHKGLEVIVPKRCRGIDIESLLQENKVWIEKQLQTISQQKALVKRPTELKLHALEETLPLILLPMQRPSLRCQLNPAKQLVVSGNIQDETAVKAAIYAWLKRYAKKTLTPWLTAVSNETGLAFNKLSIRAQKGRWGSCSVNKDISLNCKLLFLPRALAHHVLLHELCHTVHLDHSSNFWGLLNAFDPKTTINKRKINAAQQYVPAWLEI